MSSGRRVPHGPRTRITMKTAPTALTSTRRPFAVLAREYFELTKPRVVALIVFTAGEALVFAFIVGAVSMTLLVLQVNALTALLTFLSLIGYSVIYTVYLKH